MKKWNGPPHEPQYLCQAKAKHNGLACRQFAMKNGRCYYHGGKSKGAKSPFTKHGQYTKESLALQRKSTELIYETQQLITEMKL